MKILKVIVDKLPDDWSCFECGFYFEDVDGDEACAAIQNFDNELTGKIGDGELRPDWCPLQEQGGFIIDDQEVARMILNKEGAFIADQNQIIKFIKPYHSRIKESNDNNWNTTRGD